jgi:UV DNA damage endonuclease
MHHQINNPERIALGVALALALATWPRGVRPKVHFSSQRTEAHRLPARHGQEQRVLAPQLGQHADFVNPFEFAQFVRAAAGQSSFDIMLEAKAADLALLRLRDDLARIAPDVAERVC